MTLRDCVEHLVTLSLQRATFRDRLGRVRALVADCGTIVGKPAGWREALKQAFAEDPRSDTPEGDSIIGWMSLWLDRD